MVHEKIKNHSYKLCESTFYSHNLLKTQSKNVHEKLKKLNVKFVERYKNNANQHVRRVQNNVNCVAKQSIYKAH